MYFEYDPGFDPETLNPIEIRLLEELSEKPAMSVDEFLELPIKEVLTDLEKEHIKDRSASQNGSVQIAMKGE